MLHYSCNGKTVKCGHSFFSFLFLFILVVYIHCSSCLLWLIRLLRDDCQVTLYSRLILSAVGLFNGDRTNVKFLEEKFLNKIRFGYAMQCSVLA